ncbi:MAG: DUF3078 domain-containing protein [Candidatus Azobacteroides sp.]|nr:DUF3078 domain-containing protein [Candidatus Azobacteroides sp.]
MKNKVFLFFIYSIYSLQLISQVKEDLELAGLDSIIIINKNYPVTEDEFIAYYHDTLQYSCLFMPLIFDGVWVPDTLKVKEKENIYSLSDYSHNSFKCLYEDIHFGRDLELKNYLHQLTKNYAYKQRPHIIDYNLDMLPRILPEEQEINVNLLKNLFRPETDAKLDVGRIQKTYPKEVYWWKIANSVLNFSQTYLSENWYNGGESNITLLSIQNIKFGYNNKSTVEFETEIESKFSFYSTPDDTIRSFRVNEDVSFIKSKIGYKAYRKFYYTISTQFKTQLFNNYKTNTDTPVSSLFSPVNLFVDFGMDYKLNTDKLTMSVILSPFSYKWIYIKDKTVDEEQYGLEKGVYEKSDFGSSLTGDITWAFNSQINWVSRLRYYTTYESVTAEWENTFNFVLNRYLSTKLMAHVRFDDEVARNEKFDYFQYREMITFGIAFK